MLLILKEEQSPVSYIVDVNDIVKVMTDCFNGGYALNWRKSNKMCYFILFKSQSRAITHLQSCLNPNHKACAVLKLIKIAGSMYSCTCIYSDNLLNSVC